MPKKYKSLRKYSFKQVMKCKRKKARYKEIIKEMIAIVDQIPTMREELGLPMPKYVNIFKTGTESLKNGKHIVKIQISFGDGGKRMLVYNSDRSIFFDRPSTEDVKSKVKNMRGFFEIEIKGSDFKILKQVKEQDF